MHDLLDAYMNWHDDMERDMFPPDEPETDTETDVSVPSVYMTDEDVIAVIALHGYIGGAVLA